MLCTKPIELECGLDEVVCLVDNGSTIMEAWVEKQFPQHTKHVKETSRSLRGDHAKTAGGAKLYNKGRVEIDGTVDGKPFPINPPRPLASWKVEAARVNCPNCQTENVKLITDN